MNVTALTTDVELLSLAGKDKRIRRKRVLGLSQTYFDIVPFGISVH